MAERIIDYELAGYNLKLKMNDHVFVPNLTTQLLANTMEISKDDTVLDVGCGVGPIAIAAAKMGARDGYPTPSRRRRRARRSRRQVARAPLRPERAARTVSRRSSKRV